MKDSQRLFFLATDNNQPAGGRKFIYHIVDILVREGFNAYALHQKRNFRYTWFRNNTPVVYTYQIQFQRAKKDKLKAAFRMLRLFKKIVIDYLMLSKIKTNRLKVNADDILVIPETRITFIDEILPGVKKVTLSQGHFLFFRSYLGDRHKNKFFHPDIIASITMSKANLDLTQYCFPDLKIENVPVFIDSEMFRFTLKKKNQIAYMPRKSGEDASVLLNCLRYRHHLNNFSIVPIENMDQEDVARTLRESLIFLSFSHREGFGLPPAEAMACGCIVIGYSGNGGDEYFQSDLCCEIKEGDILNYAKIVEKVIDEYLTNPESLDRLRKRASDYIINAYSAESTKNALLNIFREIY